MNCSTNNPAQRRFFYRFAGTMVLYLLFLVLAVRCFQYFHPTGAAAYLLAVLPSIPLLAQIVVFGMYLAEEKDEFVRNLQIQCLLGGIGGTLAVISMLGFLENFTHVLRLHLFWVYPLFWICVGISFVVVWMKYR